MDILNVRFFAIIFFILIAAGGISSGQQDRGGGFESDPELFVPHAAVDPTNGDLLIIANSWRNERPTLRRFSSDGVPAADFALERYKACCAIHPSLIDIDNEGNIYTIEYTGELGGFYLYKHTPYGEFDIEWGQKEGTVESTDSDDYAPETDPADETAEEAYEEGETALDWNAGGGRTSVRLFDPVDLIARDDGSVLILDRNQKYVFHVSPDGREVTYFIGREGYYPVHPQRLIMDSEGYLYLVDQYDGSDINYGDMVGVFRFTPDGELISGWGEGSGGINDPWRDTLDIDTLVLDGENNLIVLGGPADMNHSEVFVFDRETGNQVLRDTVQFRMGYDEDYLGILAALDTGFIVLTQRDFEILVDYYEIDGTRKRQVTLFSTVWVS